MAEAKAGILIPARMGSKRLPGKPLQMAGDRPLLARTWEAARTSVEARKASAACVVTDSREIEAFCDRERIPCHYHDCECRTGSDRIAAALERMPGWNDVELIVNLQCDEPDLTGEDLDLLIRGTRGQPYVGTIICTAPPPGGVLNDCNAVKAMVDARDFALYFSRLDLPSGLLHVGAYCYPRRRLEDFTAWASPPMERAEKLEQLRLLYFGVPVRCFRIDRPVRSVNCREDLERFVE